MSGQHPFAKRTQRRKERERCIVSHIIFQKVFCNTSHHIKTKLLLFPPKVPWGVGGLSFRQLREQPTTYLSAERLHLAATFTFPTDSQSIPRVFKHNVVKVSQQLPIIDLAERHVTPQRPSGLIDSDVNGQITAAN